MTHAVEQTANAGATVHKPSPECRAPETAPPTMTANDSSPREGHDSSGRIETWRCRECGTLRAVASRPTRCLHCRRGEHEYGDRRLFEAFGRSVATDGGVIGPDGDGEARLRCPHCKYSWPQRDALDERTRCPSCAEKLPAAVCRLNQIGANHEWTVDVPDEVTATVDVVEEHTKEGVTRLEVLLAAVTFEESDGGGTTE